MNNTVRWTLFGLLMAVSVVAGTTLGDTWYAVIINAVTGFGAIAPAAGHLVRGRRGER